MRCAESVSVEKDGVAYDDSSRALLGVRRELRLRSDQRSRPMAVERRLR